MLPLNEQPATTTHLGGWFSVLQDSGPEDWGRRLIEIHRVIEAGGDVDADDREPLVQGTSAGGRYASAKALLWSQPEVQMYSFMGSYTKLANSMRVWERTPSSHIRELYLRIAFNCLVGNTDDHDRNTGFVAGDDGFFELSPAFDLTARTATEGAVVSLDNLLSESLRFGVAADEARDLVHAQWQTIKASLVDTLSANGCLARIAKTALASMPGQSFFGP